MNESLLTRSHLVRLLTEVGERLLARGRAGQIYVVRGAAMALTFDSRRVTRDIDAAVPGDQTDLWEAVAEVATAHRLAPDWLNTYAVAFMTDEPDVTASELTVPGLRVAIASPEHLIAMKLRAMRGRDLDDLDVLFRVVGVTDPQQAAEIHNRLFDESYIGAADPDEALYAAQLVFDRARNRGNPISEG